MEMSSGMSIWTIYLELILYSPKNIVFYMINVHFNRNLDYITCNTI